MAFPETETVVRVSDARSAIYLSSIYIQRWLGMPAHTPNLISTLIQVAFRGACASAGGGLGKRQDGWFLRPKTILS